MTNKEILHADLLDILFENRNKAYGAYALRRNYNHRLQWAIGTSLGIALILSILGYSPIKNSRNPYEMNKKEMKISSVGPIDAKKVEVPKPKIESPRKEIAYTKIKIVPNDTKTDMPDLKDILNADISNKTVDGIPSSDTVQSNKQGDVEGTSAPQKIDDKNDIHPTNSDAQYPGGKEAFAKFLTRYLRTPGDLAAGEKKVVLVRFMVDADGTISKTEILQSDGDEYSQEVIRVLSKMPKWIPAMQNGAKVTTWFTQPVSFIGVE